MHFYKLIKLLELYFEYIQYIFAFSIQVYNNIFIFLNIAKAIVI